MEIPGTSSSYSGTPGESATTFCFPIRERRLKLGTYFTFVPTQNRDANGMRQNTAPYLDLKFSIPKQTASTAELASTEMGLLSRAFRAGFTCCQPSL